tara:strand:+ start:10788 stop:11156 length:369 start_codon:yes stop_codon:yes gene_type:complete
MTVERYTDYPNAGTANGASWWTKGLNAIFDGGLDFITTGGGKIIDYATTPEGALRLGSMGLAAIGTNSSLSQPKIQPTGYQGGIPALSTLRRQVPQMMGEEMSDGSIRPQGPRPQGYPTQGT